MYGGIDAKKYIVRNDRVRLCLLRLRQRWLDGHLRPRRHPARGRPARCEQPALQEQSRRHVHRRDRAGGTPGRWLGLRRLRRRLQQRRLRGPVLHVLRPEPAVSQQRRRHVHRCDQGGRALEPAAAMGRRLQLPRLQPRWPPRPLRLQLHPLLLRARAGARGEQQLSLEGHPGRVRAARTPARTTFALSQQRRRNVHRRQRTGRASPPPPKATG